MTALRAAARRRLAGGMAGVAGRQDAGTAEAPQAGEYRDVPVPSWLWEMVEDLSDGPLIPGNGKLFQRCGTIYFRSIRAAEAAGIDDGFTPHSLRHAFASAMRHPTHSASLCYEDASAA